LSAVEGLEFLDPTFTRAVLPITLGIIVALFALQRYGTARVGALFGPIMVLWFGTLSALGIVAIMRAPEVLAALLPTYGLALLAFSALLRHSLLLALLAFRALALLSFGALALQLNLGEPRLFLASCLLTLAPLVLHCFARLALFALPALRLLALRALAPLDLFVQHRLIDDHGLDRELRCNRRALPSGQAQPERQRRDDRDVQHHG